MVQHIASMWFDGPLRFVDQVCLRSMAASGMDVTLFTYGDVTNVPTGITVRDGNEILDRSLVKRLVPIAKKAQAAWLPTVQFSDFFRVFLQKAGEEKIWLDTDVLLFQPFEFDLSQVYFARESKVGIGASVFYLPPKHPIIAEYERLLEQDDLTPDWLEFKRRVVRPAFYKLTRTAFSPSDLGITIYGNEAFRSLARRHGVFGQARPKYTFYHWTGSQCEDVYKAVPWSFFYDDPKHIGLHIHKKTEDALHPEVGSLWHSAMVKYA